MAARSQSQRLIVLALVVCALCLAWLTPAASAADGPQATVTGDLVNVRSGPGTGYGLVTRVKIGQTLPITGKSTDGKWVQVTTAGKTGWISLSLLKVAGTLDAVTVVKVAAPPKAAAASASRAAAPRPAPPGFFGYGIQVDPGNLGQSIDGAKGLGFGWVKFQLPWKDFEGGGPGQRNWPDDVIAGFNSNGLQILASIVKAPQWARPGNTNRDVEGPPADPNTYASFVGEFAARYCGRVQAIEVWNEQNLWYEWGGETLSARRYMDLLKVAYGAIKRACPGMIVVSGAPTPTGAQPPAAIRDTTYLEQMYQNGLRNFSDAIGVHPSGYGNPPDSRFQDWQAGAYSRPSHVADPSFYFRNTMEQYRNIMVKYGDGGKRLWPTEFGWASSGNPHPGYEYATYNSEQQQGEYIVRAYQIMKGWGWVGVAFLWNLNYNQTQPSTELAAFGIMGRSAYGMLQGMPR